MNEIVYTHFESLFFHEEEALNELIKRCVEVGEEFYFVPLHDVIDWYNDICTATVSTVDESCFVLKGDRSKSCTMSIKGIINFSKTEYESRSCKIVDLIFDGADEIDYFLEKCKASDYKVKFQDISAFYSEARQGEYQIRLISEDDIVRPSKESLQLKFEMAIENTIESEMTRLKEEV